MKNIFSQIKSGADRIRTRALSEGLPRQEEIEQFGADGEDVIYRMLRDEFDHVLRSVVVPHKDKYLEKDFLVLHRGVPVVIEVKNWKGKIGCDPQTGDFYQDKPGGVHKIIKSPVGTTEQYIRCMKEFYSYGAPILGIVTFAEPDCELLLPESKNGILLIPAVKLVSTIKAKVRELGKSTESLPPQSILRCTRIYSRDSEFCKGILADESIACVAEDGTPALLNTDYLRYIQIEPQPLRLRDKLSVVYTNGACEVFYNRDSMISVCCLDGSCQRFALNKLRHILF